MNDRYLRDRDLTRPADPKPYITVYGGTGVPAYSRHAQGGNGTAYMPRHGYADHVCDQFIRYGMGGTTCGRVEP